MSEPPYNPPSKNLPGWDDDVDHPDPEEWPTEEAELTAVIASSENWKIKLVKWLASQKRRINDIEALADAGKTKLQDHEARITTLEGQ